MIAIMSADVPHTLYFSTDSETNKPKPPMTEEDRKVNDDVMAYNDAIAKKLKEKKAQQQSEQWEKVTPEQIFNEQ